MIEHREFFALAASVPFFQPNGRERCIHDVKAAIRNHRYEQFFAATRRLHSFCSGDTEFTILPDYV